MVVMFLVVGIFAGVVGMVTATVMGLGLGLILAAYPVFGMAGVCVTATLALVRGGVQNVESSLG